MSAFCAHFGDPVETPINWRDSESISVETLCDYIKKGNFILNPPHQRKVVHSVDWKRGIISSLMGEAPADIPALRWHPVKGPAGKKIRVSLDGKQRLTAITEFKANGFKWRGKYYKHEELSSLTPEERNCIDDFKIINKTTNRTLTAEEILNSFNKFQQTQQTKLGERLNAVTGGALSIEIGKIMADHHHALRQIISAAAWSRFHPLEIYAKCFFYFCNGADEKCKNDIIQKMWERQMSSDYTRPSDNAMKKFGKIMQWTLRILLDRRTAKVTRKSTKILQLFLLMKWSRRQIEHRDDHYEFICENLFRLTNSAGYGNVAGNHSSHVKHFEFLRAATQSEAEFQDASTGDEDA